MQKNELNKLNKRRYSRRKTKSIFIRLLFPVGLIIIFQLVLTELVMALMPEESEILGRLAVMCVTVLTGASVITTLAHFITAPFDDISRQLKAGDNNPINMPETGIEQIDIFLRAINEMREKRKSIEHALIEDKERYLLALESAADAFIEYDAAADTFMTYYFISTDDNSEIKAKTFTNFTDAVNAGEVFHMDDIPAVTAFLRADNRDPIEARIAVLHFPYIKGVPNDGGYYWFRIQGSFIFDEPRPPAPAPKTGKKNALSAANNEQPAPNGSARGELKRIIGTAKQITNTKLRETQLAEASLRDVTTGFYNRDYGTTLIKNEIYNHALNGTPHTLVALRVTGHHAYEAHYGRYYAGIVLRLLCKKILEIIDDNIAVRLNNYEFLFLFTGEDQNAVKERLRLMREALSRMYLGENEKTVLSLAAGIAPGSPSSEYKNLFPGAYTAAYYAAKSRASIAYASDILSRHLAGDAAFNINPINIDAEITKENIAALAFDLFEHTTDIESVVKILLVTIGDLFELGQVIISSYDADFSISRISYQWAAEGRAEHNAKIEKVSQDDIEALEQMLDDNGALIFNGQFTEYFTPGLKNLLCITNDEDFSAICCAMYESGVHAGRIICKADDPNKIWSGDEMACLNEVTKIIAAHISVQKSNSASRAKSEFLSRMSHEIRTPMNAIIGMTGIAKESTDNKERLSDCLNKIDFSAKHLLALINDVLEMSRIESGKLVIKEEPFLFDNLARDIEILMRPPIEEKKIGFIMAMDTPSKYVLGDEYRIKQVLVNFLGNASKFTDPGGVITLTVSDVTAQRAGAAADAAAADSYGYFLFSVKDTGIGISKEDQQTVFEAFEQASGERQRQGTGLGLAISSNIVTAMGSQIELKSELGAGSEFSFTLKLKTAPQEEEQAAAETDAENTQDKALTDKRVLLVDDNELNIEIAKFVLEGFGVIVETADNGQKAVDAFKQSAPFYFDAILMDIQMPVMDGLTATREIRKCHERGDAGSVPIIAMTADAFEEDKNKSIESGMNGHVAKPVDNDKLYETLKRLV